MTRYQGPYVKKVIVRIMSRIAVPDNGDLSDAIKFLSDKDTIISAARKATEDAFIYIDAVKNAKDSPYTDDESAAKAVLDKISERTQR